MFHDTSIERIQWSNDEDKYFGEVEKSIDHDFQLNDQNTNNEVLTFVTMEMNKSNRIENLDIRLKSNIRFVSTFDLVRVKIDEDKKNNEENNWKKNQNILNQIFRPSSFDKDKIYLKMEIELVLVWRQTDFL